MDSKKLSSTAQKATDNLYHVILTTSQVPRDPKDHTEKVRVVGTYDNHCAAKKRAQTFIRDCGPRRMTFSTYEVRDSIFDEDKHSTDYDPGVKELFFHAVNYDGTVYRLETNTTPNDLGLCSYDPEGLIDVPLFFSITASRASSKDEMMCDVSVEGAFLSYECAREFANDDLLLDGAMRDRFHRYNKALFNEKQCGHGKNVVAHADGTDGEQFFVAVIASWNSNILEWNHAVLESS
ncbi:hypothetical protein BDW62DRAFT_198077 [Aspergillus aurantiobrunneus]